VSASLTALPGTLVLNLVVGPNTVSYSPWRRLLCPLLRVWEAP
jgi:hypothetical protein